MTLLLISRVGNLRIVFIDDEEEGDADEEEGGADEAGASGVQEIRVPASNPGGVLLEVFPVVVASTDLLIVAASDSSDAPLEILPAEVASTSSLPAPPPTKGPSASAAGAASLE